MPSQVKKSPDINEAVMSNLPPDIHHDTRCRLPPAPRPTSPEGQHHYDSHVMPNIHSIRGLHGPAGIYMHSPELALKRRAAGRYLRFEADITPRQREVAILTTARCCQCRFEWAAHEQEALSHGVPQKTITAIAQQSRLDDIDEQDACIIQLGREIFLNHHVDSASYADCLKQFGTKNLVDLVALMGSYAATAALLIAFDMHIDEGASTPF
jgi:alkylhydroperoxidase family enzyme